DRGEVVAGRRPLDERGHAEGGPGIAALHERALRIGDVDGAGAQHPHHAVGLPHRQDARPAADVADRELADEGGEHAAREVTERLVAGEEPGDLGDLLVHDGSSAHRWSQRTAWWRATMPPDRLRQRTPLHPAARICRARPSWSGHAWIDSAR